MRDCELILTTATSGDEGLSVIAVADSRVFRLRLKPRREAKTYDPETGIQGTSLLASPHASPATHVDETLTIVSNTAHCNASSQKDPRVQRDVMESQHATSSLTDTSIQRSSIR